MSHKNSQFVYLSLIFTAVIFISNAAFSALGEKETSVINDAKVLGAPKTQKKSLSVQSTIKIHVLKYDGNTVKEFVDSNGRVFAISWHGLKTPNLGILLGSYYTEYDKETSRQPIVSGRRHQQTETSKIKVIQYGPMMNLYGSAYLIHKLPPEFNLSELNEF